MAATSLFVAVERRAKQPILPLNFFRNQTYSLMIIVALLFGAGFLGSILYLTQFNQQVYGATASEAGLMLLPMVGGMMMSSIGTGQLVSRVGKYKRFIMTGFVLSTVSILALITLQSDTPYWHEAVIMAVCGLGLGMAMPILNLAVQNEFEQKDLGAATSSVQLFRGLGSTVGTALLSGLLTTGILAAVGNPNSLPYIQTLKTSPASAQMLGEEITADTLLQINAQEEVIKQSASAGFAKIPVPQVREAATQKFAEQQRGFHDDIIDAFTESLHRIFMVSSGLMALALCVVSFVKERPLRSGVKATPGE
jgi:MFS family permease